MSAEELFVPEFLLAEIPIKDKSVQDDRLWIYSSKYVSLIEAYCEGFVVFVFPLNMIQKKFEYVNSDGVTETWNLVFVQNNVGFVDSEKNPVEVLDDAFHFLETYLTWEDINLDFGSE
ncbi:hypothetical protein [Lacihabitans soyangensis]|uniref:Uncharacterized protein n=1 Tax=Lacihabitans soyangensis TaxID=869394 RepID=A0AAE3KV78_9BACT|nr:hypothetical protein [Lacihabitans soyangensis]MCP9763911.1 hypothetical protein [Lacihabitans soyangensis]